MDEREVSLVGEVGSGMGAPLKVFLLSSGVIVLGDPRTRMGADAMANLNGQQAYELAGLLTRAATAEPPPGHPIETFQADPNSAHPPKPIGDVEPIHRR